MHHVKGRGGVWPASSFLLILVDRKEIPLQCPCDMVHHMSI